MKGTSMAISTIQKSINRFWSLLSKNGAQAVVPTSEDKKDLKFLSSKGTWEYATAPTGPQGPVGPMGPQGIQGVQGEQGETGPVGPQGPTGEKGEKGEAFSIARMFASVAEMNASFNDQDVKEGQFVLINTGDVEDADDARMYVKGKEAYSFVCDLSGAAGIQGPKGDTGMQGVQGIQGEQGVQGVAGEQGPKGDTGARGEQGPKGDTGAVGPKGDTGEQGPKGDTGAKGDTGDKGDTGLQGPKGDTGAKGADANTFLVKKQDNVAKNDANFDATSASKDFSFDIDMNKTAVVAGSVRIDAAYQFKGTAKEFSVVGPLAVTQSELVLEGSTIQMPDEEGLTMLPFSYDVKVTTGNVHVNIHTDSAENVTNPVVKAVNVYVVGFDVA